MTGTSSTNHAKRVVHCALGIVLGDVVFLRIAATALRTRKANHKHNGRGHEQIRTWKYATSKESSKNMPTNENTVK